MKKLFVLLIALSMVTSASLAVVQKASPEAKAKVKAKTQAKAKQKAKNGSKFTPNKNKVHQDAILQKLKYEMSIKKGSNATPPSPEDIHPSEQF